MGEYPCRISNKKIKVIFRCNIALNWNIGYYRSGILKYHFIEILEKYFWGILSRENISLQY